MDMLHQLVLNMNCSHHQWVNKRADHAYFVEHDFEASPALLCLSTLPDCTRCRLGLCSWGCLAPLRCCGQQLWSVIRGTLLWHCSFETQPPALQVEKTPFRPHPDPDEPIPGQQWLKGGVPRYWMFQDTYVDAATLIPVIDEAIGTVRARAQQSS